MRAVILSDLHLGATAGTATSDAFASFAEWLQEQTVQDAVTPRLVLLGDFVDLLHAPPGARDPLDALGAVALQHRAAFAALGFAAAKGVRIDIVPGNHDSELVDPVVQAHLGGLVADAAGTSAEKLRESLRVQPWFLLVPGLMYAEHGSQYHALNAVADPLAPFGRWSHRLPVGAALDLFLSGTGRRRMRGLPRLVAAALPALTGYGRTGAPTAASREACGAASGLSPAALDSLLRLAEDSPAALLRSASAAALRRAGLVESQQQRAAIAVRRILAAEGQPVPVYVFGHTHRTAQCALDAGGRRVLWFNCGAWSDAGGGFVEVSRRPGSVAARLCRWDAVTRSAFTLSGPAPVATRVAQELTPTRRRRSVGSGSVEPVARP